MIDNDGWTINDGGKQCPLDAPTLVSPTDESSTHNGLYPTFHWSAVTDATGYELEYSTEDTFTSPSSESSTTTSVMLDELALGTWYWRVKATAGVTESDWSEVRSFTIEALDAPTLVSPADESSTYEQYPTFHWMEVTDATSYHVQYSTDETFTAASPLYCGDTSCSPPHELALGTWYWRVRARMFIRTVNGVRCGSFTIIESSPDDFIITVKTDNLTSPDSSPDTMFVIPTTGTGYNYNVDCDSDGVDDATAQTGDYFCMYDSSGTYTIRIKDNAGDGTGFPRFYAYYYGDGDKVLTIEQWGTGKWASMQFAFYDCSNLTIPATDIPDLSIVMDMQAMFASASSFNSDISPWNTSKVTNMAGVFHSAISFNQDISGWDTSSVTIMGGAVYECQRF